MPAHLLKLFKPKFSVPCRAGIAVSSILDLGVANNSYRECKAVFPGAQWHGIDREDPAERLQPGDTLTILDLDAGDLRTALGDRTYDLILANHVLEHLRAGAEVFREALTHVRPGGMLFAEFPSVRSLSRPPSRFSYHFHDDVTHRRLYDPVDLANVALEQGFRVYSLGPSSTLVKNLASIPRAILSLGTRGTVGGNLAHVAGQIDHVAVTRPADASMGA